MNNMEANPGFLQQNHRSMVLAGNWLQRSFGASPAHSRYNEIFLAGLCPVKLDTFKDGGSTTHLGNVFHYFSILTNKLKSSQHLIDKSKAERPWKET